MIIWSHLVCISLVTSKVLIRLDELTTLVSELTIMVTIEWGTAHLR